MESAPVETLAPIVTFDTKHVSAYGTESKDYRLWIDYVYDWIQADIDHTARWYIVSALIGCTLWTVNLLIVAPFGLAATYVRTTGTYIIAIFIALVCHGLRWISQTYHPRTNALRLCFPVPDDRYRALATRIARTASSNLRILTGSITLSIIMWVYVAIVVFDPSRTGKALSFGFPATFGPAWRTGSNLIPKMIVLDLYSGSCMFVLFTGIYILLATFPFYTQLAKFDVVPIPAAVTELFTGVLNLYVVGVLLFSSGAAMLELLYDARLDSLTIGFDVLAFMLSLAAYLTPRLSIHRILKKSRQEGILFALRLYYRDQPGSSVNIAELNDSIRSVTSPNKSGINWPELLNLLGSQILPIATVVGKTLLSSRLGA